MKMKQKKLWKVLHKIPIESLKRNTKRDLGMRLHKSPTAKARILPRVKKGGKNGWLEVEYVHYLCLTG